MQAFLRKKRPVLKSMNRRYASRHEEKNGNEFSNFIV
jgi:hypothetical protein